ncbi:YopT-type cysteine protease domain-containing protein [Microbulbifer sp. A4B17]|uniref:YopT-type cysteine protease domain-containing protein n=1 Tax=Microbulbifer sp. A4B17 TaxID=359370 RepID=UPI001300A76D|nr:YopT-type cysteine protease domain-containing protein [Microbulbifer sp. A4B17]
MPMWLDKVVLNLTATRVPAVQQSVITYNGAYIPFSQCEDPIYSHITSNAATCGGICEALAAFWIKHHADGNDLWSWLKPDGVLNVGNLNQVMALQRQGINPPPHQNQDTVTELWLQGQNILPAKYSAFQYTLPNGRGGRQIRGYNQNRISTGTSALCNANALAREIILDHGGAPHSDTRSGRKTSGVYKKISIESTVFGFMHTMSAWVAEDISFFDPNFGEFYFSTKTDFVNWFTQSFWFSSSYALGLSGAYEIFTYSSRA